MKQAPNKSIPSLEEKYKRLQIEKMLFEETKQQLKALLLDLEEKDKQLKQAAGELNKFKQAVDASTDAVIMTSPDQKIIYCNTACEKLTGYGFNEMSGKDPIKMLMSEKTDKKILTEMQETIGVGKAFSTEEVFIRNTTGDYIQVGLSIFPIHEDDRLQFFVGLLQNIKERKEIEKMKTEFVSIASHQLRTPMAGIQWVAERLLKKEKLSKSGREYITDIHMSVKKLASLVDLLLNVSRIESGHVGISPKPLEIIGFIQSFLAEMKPYCAKKNITLTFDKHPKEMQVISDTSALRNIVQSLVSNAIEYTPDGGRVDITLEKRKIYLRLAIRDTGIGIPKEEQKEIFTKFKRASNAKKVKTDGTGLGLHIAYEATKLLDGKTWFESEGEGKGTTFIVELPFESKAKEGEKKLS
jgi:PAS domain S-box-containing protein